jgi:uncharacterized membrane protein
VIRFLGLLNIAVWVGASLFFTVAVGPAFFSSEMLSFLPRPYAGRAAEVVLERYFLVQQWCAGVGIAYLVVDYFYTGRPLDVVNLSFVAGLLAIGVFAGHWLQPRMHELQRVRYAQNATPPQKEEATARFKRFHATSQTMNLLAILAGLGSLYRTWRTPAGVRLTDRMASRISPLPPAPE